MVSTRCLAVAVLLALIEVGTALTIAEINGNAFISPYAGQFVINVTGVVTAKSSTGIFVRSLTPDNDPRTSESIFVYDRNQARQRRVGEIIDFSGRVTAYRSSEDYVPLTEITNPTVRATGNITSNSTIAPVYVTGSRTPPVGQYNCLDFGNIFALPNNGSQVSNANRPLEPGAYTMDFWQSLMGELVTITLPISASKINSYGEVWIYSNEWNTISNRRNSRGGLTQIGTDANGDAILLGAPLDGSRNPNQTVLGDGLGDYNVSGRPQVTGVVYQQFGNYYILPLTGVAHLYHPPNGPLDASFQSSGQCDGLTVGQYNVENLSPNSSSVSYIALHIARSLQNPDVVLLQEIQDDSGPTNNGVVDANATLSTLTRLIVDRGGVQYSYVDIDPADGTNGGQPGGNIRSAYLYNPSHVSLYKQNTGSATQSTEVVGSVDGPTLSLNPGLLSPLDPAFEDSRKPIVAQWATLDGQNRFFTINLHLTSKGESTTLNGDARTPVNGGVEKRAAQLKIVSDFVNQILDQDPDAAIIVAGDYNEFESVSILDDFRTNSRLTNLDDAAGVQPVDRYTYIFGPNSQELDHAFVSSKIASRAPKVEHVHVNTWGRIAGTEAGVSPDVAAYSDHDPSVAQINVCR